MSRGYAVHLGRLRPTRLTLPKDLGNDVWNYRGRVKVCYLQVTTERHSYRCETFFLFNRLHVNGNQTGVRDLRHLLLDTFLRLGSKLHRRELGKVDEAIGNRAMSDNVRFTKFDGDLYNKCNVGSLERDAIRSLCRLFRNRVLFRPRVRNFRLPLMPR